MDLSHAHFAGWTRMQIDEPNGAKPLPITAGTLSAAAAAVHFGQIRAPPSA